MERVFERFIFGLVILKVAVEVYSKEWHVKENLDMKEKDIKEILNILDMDEAIIKNDRSARHVQTVTESVLNHLLTELQHQYRSPRGNQRSTMSQLLHRFENHIRKTHKRKLHKKKRLSKQSKMLNQSESVKRVY